MYKSINNDQFQLFYINGEESFEWRDETALTDFNF